MLRALRHKNYRNYFLGQSVSLIGTWIQQVATSWLIYRLTGSAFLLGLVGFLDKIPMFLVTPFAGVFVDRHNRHRIVLTTQFLLLLQAAILAALTLSGKIQVWHILTLSTCLGLINSFDVPARQSFTLDMVNGREDLGNAIALNSTVFNGARLLGPALAGLIIGLSSEGVCFTLNAVSYLAVLAALAMMKFARPLHKPTDLSLLAEFREGFRYAYGFKPMRSILLLLMGMNLLGMPFTVLLPVFARELLGGGAHTLGFLMGATGGGALLGALFLAQRESVLGLGKWIWRSSGIFAVSIIAFSFSRRFPLSMACLFISGFGMMVQMAASNTVLQTISSDEMRGRVVSFYVVSISGMAPFGSLFAGSIASRLGAPHTILLGGLACLLGSLLFFLQLPEYRSHIRPIYERLGILPEEVKVQAIKTDRFFVQ